MTRHPSPPAPCGWPWRKRPGLLEADPALAAEQALEVLKVLPNHPPQWCCSPARRRAGNPKAAIEVLEPLMRTQAAGAAAWFEYGLALGNVGRGDEAIRALKKTVSQQPGHAGAWRALGDHLLAIGDHEGGDAASRVTSSHRRTIRTLRQAAVAMVRNDVPYAELCYGAFSSGCPPTRPAIRMLAEVGVRCGRNEDAQKLLERCLELAPGFAAARYNYAMLLHRLNDPERRSLKSSDCCRRIRATRATAICAPSS